MNSLSAVLLALAPAFLAPLGPVAADQRPVGLRSLNFEAAKSAARVERRPILILFCDGEVDCNRIATDMLSEIKLRTWLDDNLVAIQVDQRVEDDLASRFRIRTSPTYLFTDAKGTELDRIVGARDSKTLRSEGEEILKGGDPLERLQKKRKGRETDPDMRLRYADILCDRGEMDTALAEYLAVQAQGGTAGAAALEELVRMGRMYPKAGDAIGAIASSIEPKIRSGVATDAEFQRWLDLCRSMRLQLRMLGLYDAMEPYEEQYFDEEGQPIDEEVVRVAPTAEEVARDARIAKLRKRIAPALRDLFYTDQRYMDYATLIDDALADFARRKADHAEIEARGDASATSTSLALLRGDTARDYEVLISVRRLGEGTLLADALIGFDTTVATYNALVENALRAMQPAEAKLLANRGRADVRIDPQLRKQIAPSIPVEAK